MQDVPYGFCHCGCGERTNLARQTAVEKGWIKGEPLRFIRFHHRRTGTSDYIVEDRGYKTPCWVWQRSVTPNGYGKLADRYAHRMYYEQNVGPIPDGMELDHLCRVRQCCRPDHLEPVPHTVNIRRGDRAGKLNREIAQAIRTSNEPRRLLAERYGVSTQAVGLIQRGVSYADDSYTE